MNNTTNTKRGAPTKAVKWPAVPFTLTLLTTVNAEGNAQSKGALYQKVKKGVVDGSIIQLTPATVAKGKGRRAEVFVLKEYFDPTSHNVLVKITPEMEAIAARLRAATPVLVSATFTSADFKG